MIQKRHFPSAIALFYMSEVDNFILFHTVLIFYENFIALTWFGLIMLTLITFRNQYLAID